MVIRRFLPAIERVYQAADVYVFPVQDLLGSIELIEGDKRSALAVAHRFIENQGDAWTVTGAYLGRFVDDQRILAATAAPEPVIIAGPCWLNQAR